MPLWSLATSAEQGILDSSPLLRMDTTSLQIDLKTVPLRTPVRRAGRTTTSVALLRVSHGGCTGEAPLQPGEDYEALADWIRTSCDPNAGPTTPPPDGPATARAAFDITRLDAVGRRIEKAIHQIWNLNLSKCPPGSAAVPPIADQAVYRAAIADFAHRYPAIKLLLGTGSMEEDESLIAVAREAAPMARFFIDADGVWTVAQAAKIIPLLSKWDIDFVIQPVPVENPEGWAELSAALPSRPCPLVADRSVVEPGDLPAVAPHVNGVVINPFKHGGMDKTREFVTAARASQLTFVLSSGLASTLGATAAAHFAPYATFLDLGQALWLKENDYAGISYDSMGEIILPEGFGVGATLRPPKQ